MKEPVLAERGATDLAELLDNIKEKVMKDIQSGLDGIYQEIGPYVETDAWQNYRNDMKQQLAYDNGILKDDYGWARNVRLKILQENRGELVELLNKDLMERVKELEDRQKEYDSRRYSI